MTCTTVNQILKTIASLCPGVHPPPASPPVSLEDRKGCREVWKGRHLRSLLSSSSQLPAGTSSSSLSSCSSAPLGWKCPTRSSSSSRTFPPPAQKLPLCHLSLSGALTGVLPLPLPLLLPPCPCRITLSPPGTSAPPSVSPPLSRHARPPPCALFARICKPLLSPSPYFAPKPLPTVSLEPRVTHVAPLALLLLLLHCALQLRLLLFPRMRIVPERFAHVPHPHPLLGRSPPPSTRGWMYPSSPATSSAPPPRQNLSPPTFSTFLSLRGFHIRTEGLSSAYPTSTPSYRTSPSLPPLSFFSMGVSTYKIGSICSLLQCHRAHY